MQERGKKKQRQSIIMLSAVQTDIETKAQVGPHTAKPFKIKTEKKKKKLLIHLYCTAKSFLKKKRKENSQLSQTFLPVPRLVDSKIKRLKSWIDLNVTLILCHFKVILRICKLVNVFFIVFHFQIFEY